MLGSRRTDAVIFAADGHVLNWFDRLFFGVHDLQLFDTALFQFPTHDLCQRTHVRFIDIRHAELRRVQLVSSSHAADDRHIARFGAHDNLNLRCHGINSIHHV